MKRKNELEDDFESKLTLNCPSLVDEGEETKILTVVHKIETFLHIFFLLFF